MQADTIRRLYDYTYWAHDQVWTCVQALTEEQYRRDLGYSWGSIHDLMVHIMSAEWIWFSRMRGVFPETMLKPDDFPTQAAVRERWAEIEADVRAFLAELTDEKLAGDFSYTTTRGIDYSNRLLHVLLHVVNHGTDHRAQILAMVNQLGGPTVEQDLIFFLRQQEG